MVVDWFAWTSAMNNSISSTVVKLQNCCFWLLNVNNLLRYSSFSNAELRATLIDYRDGFLLLLNTQSWACFTRAAVCFSFYFADIMSFSNSVIYLRS
jgi:hypothetical protein